MRYRMHTSLPLVVERPKTRKDCENGIRPCPWGSCRHHLGIHLRKPMPCAGGSITPLSHGVSMPLGEDLDSVVHTCSLDAASEGERTPREVGLLMGISDESVRQATITGLAGVRLALQRYTDAPHGDIRRPL